MTDIVVRNARVWSPGRVPPDADTAVIHDGVFAFVGRSQDANPPAGARTIDAAGRRMLPGFTDAHVHLMATGAAMQAVDLKGVPTVEEAARRVAERASTVSPGTWIRGTGWDQHLWPDASFPDRRSLDAIAPGHPVVLTHTSGHCIWVNGLALRGAGMMSAAVAPAGGSIDVDEQGEPTGILRDNASRLVQAVVPSPEATERIAMLRAAIAHAHSL